MILKLIAVSIAGGILCLDRIVLQAMISRPIVAAPLIGLVLGDLYTGLIAGAFIELFWIDRLPIGAYTPPEDTVVAILITASSIESARLLGGFSEGLVALAVLIAVPLGILAQRMELWLCRGNEKLVEEALSGAVRSDVGAITRSHCTAILKAYLLSVTFILVATALLIPAMTWIYPRLALPVARGLGLLYDLFPLLGVAVAINAVSIRGTVPIFCAIFLCLTVIFGFMRGS